MENKDVIYHYGIKGMKWGIRRFQNKNGTSTAAGKKRYKTDAENKKRSTEQNAIKQERIRQKKYLRNKRLITVGRNMVNQVLDKKGSSFRIPDSAEAAAQYALAKKYVRDTFR